MVGLAYFSVGYAFTYGEFHIWKPNWRWDSTFYFLSFPQFSQKLNFTQKPPKTWSELPHCKRIPRAFIPWTTKMHTSGIHMHWLASKENQPSKHPKKSQLQNSSWIVEKTCRKPEHFGEMNCSLQRIIQFEQPRIANNNNSNNKKENAPKKKGKEKGKKIAEPRSKS